MKIKTPRPLFIVIVEFLKMLTGDQPGFQMPILPPSKDKTTTAKTIRLMPQI